MERHEFGVEDKVSLRSRVFVSVIKSPIRRNEPSRQIGARRGHEHCHIGRATAAGQQTITRKQIAALARGLHSRVDEGAIIRHKRAKFGIVANVVKRGAKMVERERVMRTAKNYGPQSSATTGLGEFPD